MKSAVAVRHVPFEDLGTLETLLGARGYAVRYHDAGVHGSWTLDEAHADLLIVLGGPIGVGDEPQYPFLRDELEWIGSRLSSRRPLLGICLGAQLIATAAGAAVRPMRRKEIGFGPVTLTDAGRASPLAPLAAGVSVLHWHGDAFDVPAGAVALAGTALCPHQAFAIGRHALALQFHLEADVHRLEQWLIGHAVELGAAGIDPRRLREQARHEGGALAGASAAVFGAWLDALPAPADAAG